MSKKEMVKKHSITCSVILVLVVISRIFIYSAPSAKPLTAARIQGVNLQVKPIFVENKNVPDDFSFANESIPLDDQRINSKIGRSLKQNSFKRIQSHVLQIKAARLFPVIEPILKMYGIPEDFKYIPLVESGLCEGVSPRGAAGLWQFMPGTARTYGLKVNKLQDERRNIRKSTIAACKYIKELYGEFNSWTLAAAAYNIGSIKLQKAINKQSEDNYYRMHFNRETGTYVYKLIAMKEIISKPRQYGYKELNTNPKLISLLASN